MVIPPSVIVWPNGVACSGLHVLRPGGDDVESSRLVFDFGREVHGIFRCRFDRPLRLFVSLGESVSEALGEGYWSQFGLHQGGEFEIGPCGFRFVCIDASLDDNSEPIVLDNIRAECVERSFANEGWFRSSDERLNRIWSVGAESVRLCSQETVWDGIKRGRCPWAGDLYPAARAGFAAFGPEFGSVVEQSLAKLYAHANRSTDGLSWINGIGPYSAWWLIVASDWYQRTMSVSFLEALRDPILAITDQLLAHIDNEGVEHLGGWRFLDWGTEGYGPSTDAGIQGIAARAVECSSLLADGLGETALSHRARTIKPSMHALAQMPDPSHKLAWATLVQGGLIDPVVANRRSLAVNPLLGLSPFLGYAVLEARAEAGDLAGALDVVRRFWGAMVDLGASTYWEDFAFEWLERGLAPIDQENTDPCLRSIRDFGRSGHSGHSMSLCHAWSSGPTAWLNDRIVGLDPIPVGPGRYRLRPYLCDLDWLDARVHTYVGPIEVRVERRADRSEVTKLVAPAGLDVDVD